MRRLDPSVLKIKKMISLNKIKPEFRGVVFYSKGFKNKIYAIVKNVVTPAITSVLKLVLCFL